MSEEHRGSPTTVTIIDREMSAMPEVTALPLTGIVVDRSGGPAGDDRTDSGRPRTVASHPRHRSARELRVERSWLNSVRVADFGRVRHRNPRGNCGGAATGDRGARRLHATVLIGTIREPVAERTGMSHASSTTVGHASWPERSAVSPWARTQPLSLSRGLAMGASDEPRQEPDELLDRFLPDYDVVERHRFASAHPRRSHWQPHRSSTWRRSPAIEQSSRLAS